jgi:hypothetical protein
MTFFRLCNALTIAIFVFLTFFSASAQETSDSTGQKNIEQIPMPGSPSPVKISTPTETPATGSNGFHTRVFGMGSYEFGEIMDGQYRKAPAPYQLKLYHYWMQKLLLQIGVEVKRDDGLSIILAGEGMLHFPYALPDDGANGGYIYYLPRTTWYPHHAEVQYTAGNTDKCGFQIGAGFFPYKYNKDGRNFGEYLYRLSSYPQYMPTNFDTPYQRLLGFHISNTLFSSFQQELLLTSEIYLWPLRDFSLTYLAGYDLFGFATIGAGIMGNRIFSVDDTITRPTMGTNPHHFTFASTKLMAKAALDCKHFLPLKDWWGENDWRLYGEACINGLTNYPIDDTADGLYPGYNSMATRLPISFGFNIPTCKLLNVLSVEVEYWKTDFANSYSGVFLDGYAQAPNPTKYNKSGHSEAYGGPWYWSVYAKKIILKNIKLMAQASRDHTIIETSQTGTSTGDPQEAMDGLGNWMWMFKIEYGF